MKVKARLVFEHWIDPMKPIGANTEPGLDWLHSGCMLEAEIEMDEDDAYEIKDYDKVGLKPVFYIEELK